jgi:long-subunit fatty acid transport protein
VLVAACSWVAPGVASAQNTNEINAGIQFDFSLPGARSLAMGGAFVALADDATAAYSNPAGLVILSRPELSAEGRGWNFLTSMPSYGHAFGPPRNEGADNVAGLVDQDFTSRARGPAFLSFVYPAERFSFAVFTHQLSRFNTRKTTEGPYYACSGGYRDERPEPRPPFCEVSARASGVDREFPRQQSIDLDIRSYGASLAFQFSERLSIGLSGHYYAFELDSWNRVFSPRGWRQNLDGTWTRNPDSTAAGAWFGDPDFTYPDNVEVESTQDGRDYGLGMTVGLLWKPVPKLAVGASFRRGPRFTFELKTVLGPAHECVGNKVACTDVQGNPQPPRVAGHVEVAVPRNPFKVPDTYAIGLAFNPTQTTTLSLEYDRVQYSQLIADMPDAYRASAAESAVLLSHMRLDDAHQVRVGFEYLKLLRGTSILALQLGGWYDPDHTMHFRPDDPATGLPAPRFTLGFPPGSDQVHVTTGIGFVVSESLQVDAAFDYSRTVKTFSLSAVLMR